MVKSHPKSKIEIMHSGSKRAGFLLSENQDRYVVLQVEELPVVGKFDLLLETVSMEAYQEAEKEKEIQYLESGLERYHVQILEDEIKELHRIAENGEAKVRFVDDDYEEPFCGRCGVRVEDGDNYCRVCGVKIDWGTNDEV